MILRDLYYGRVNPSRDIVPKDKEYHHLRKKIGEERDYLISRVPEADRERFEDYNNLLYQSEAMQNYANFEWGYRFGMMLLLEGLAEETGEEESSLIDILADKRLAAAFFVDRLNARKDYREALKIQDDADKIAKENLNESQRKAVDGLILAVNHCGAVLSIAAYEQGLKDGIRLSSEF